MKKGDKVTTTHVEGIFTVKSIDEKSGIATIKQQRGLMFKVPASEPFDQEGEFKKLMDEI